MSRNLQEENARLREALMASQEAMIEMHNHSQRVRKHIQEGTLLDVAARVEDTPSMANYYRALHQNCTLLDEASQAATGAVEDQESTEDLLRDLLEGLIVINANPEWVRSLGRDSLLEAAESTARVSPALAFYYRTMIAIRARLGLDAQGDVPEEQRSIRALLSVTRELFRFTSMDDWVNHARDRFQGCGYPSHRTVCIDARGRVCVSGAEFMRADRESAYPVRVFLI